ncbi:hypothetical protein ACA910_010793 [Epithemia clementina (nom. ined.)]
MTVEEGESASEDESNSVYDSEDAGDWRVDGDADDADQPDSSEEEFEDQGSSDDDDDLVERQKDIEDSDDDVELSYEQTPRSWGSTVDKKSIANHSQHHAHLMHTDDLSSDDEDGDGDGNRIGRVPLHWYDEFDHVGYDAHGQKVAKSASIAAGDRLEQAIAMQDNKANGKFVVHDALNDRNIELTPRQVELIRRVQAGAYGHPEHDGNPEYIDYFSGVDQEISGIGNEQYEPKSRFQPSKWEKMQVQKLLESLERGDITMDYLKGNSRQLKKDTDPQKLYLLWTGDEEDEISMRKGPQHIAAPKAPPPGHAESYVPPEEYLPTEEEKKQWEDLEPKDRPHGLLVPKKFPNLRSVGAYEHYVREAFERCLDLYLCPRAMKRRLNIDPESLVPRLPKSGDLKPFPNAKCVEYLTPQVNGRRPMIRCVTASPGGQYMASGASDGFLRLWEVETGRLLKSWDLSSLALSASDQANESKDNLAIVSLDWNPNRTHHCLLAAVGKCVVVVATGTAGKNDEKVTDALLTEATKGGNVTTAKAMKAVQWKALPIASSAKPLVTSSGLVGPICLLQTNYDVGNVRWQAKGDYFVSVSPKAGAPAVLIHQLSRGNSQQPFSKAKGEAQVACFHPSKPFLFVASQQHVRVYHLVKQSMVKRLVSGCRWISSLDVHPSGDHLIAGSLDRRMVWFDLDLSATPYKTLKYHERALRSCRFHSRYPLMASASDDGAVHVFHSMVYNDLMRNPLIVPVKILRGHAISDKLGVLSICFHPTQPWVFTAGADGKIILYQDI